MMIINISTCDEYHPRYDQTNSRNKRHALDPLDKEDKQYWMEQGTNEIKQSLNMALNKRTAKNIILVVGDGMSLATVAGARVRKGQLLGEDGARSSLSWETFPYTALTKTYTSDSIVPDSAATAFAMFSGVKTTSFTMGYGNTIVRKSVRSMSVSKEVDTVLDWAEREGMMTGLVTNTRVTHATPAALYARISDRDWECDVPGDEKVLDITRQLVETKRGQSLDLVLGGGSAAFSSVPRASKSYSSPKWPWKCNRKDKTDLLEKWKKIHGNKGVIVRNKEELKGIDIKKTDKVLGLFTPSYMPYDDQMDNFPTVPSLENMTATAVDFLASKSGDKGFFLMVEGGRIDHAHHDGQATRALGETLAVDRAVEKILSRVDTKDTLVIVTADHSHTLTLGGYPGRGVDITGVSKGDSGWVFKAKDGLPFPVLGYANGPGFMKLSLDKNISTSDWRAIKRDKTATYGDPEHVYPGGVPLTRETHGGDDTGVWAIGPWSHLVHGTREQTYIGHLMSVAACIGPHKMLCNSRRRKVE